MCLSTFELGKSSQSSAETVRANRRCSRSSRVSPFPREGARGSMGVWDRCSRSELASIPSSAVWLDHGKVARIGSPQATVAAYLGGERRGRYVAESRKSLPQLLEAEILGPGERPASRVLNTDPVIVRMRYHLPHRHSGVVVGIGVLSADGTTLFTTNTNDVAADVPEGAGGHESS